MGTMETELDGLLCLEARDWLLGDACNALASLDRSDLVPTIRAAADDESVLAGLIRRLTIGNQGSIRSFINERFAFLPFGMRSKVFHELIARHKEWQKTHSASRKRSIEGEHPFPATVAHIYASI